MKEFLKVFGDIEGHAIHIPYTNSIEYRERYFILFKAAYLNVNMRSVLCNMFKARQGYCLLSEAVILITKMENLGVF